MGKAFDTEFRDMIVQLHLDQDKPIKRIAEEYGVSASFVSRWVVAYRNRMFISAQKLSKGVPLDNANYKLNT